MAAGSGGIVHAIRVDVRRLHETWMELIFPRQRGAGDTVLGKWTPNTTSGMVGYRLWGVLGVLIVALLYPLAVVGFATRYYASRLNTAATRLGLAGVVLLTAIVWGALTLAARFQFSREGFLAVAAASVVATVSSALAVLFKRIDGRPVTILLAYPFAVTAVLLPPVVAAFFSAWLAQQIFPGTESLAAVVLDNLGALGEYIRDQFELTGIAYAVLWFGISFPIGWFFGLLVTLADAVRPTGE